MKYTKITSLLAAFSFAMSSSGAVQAADHVAYELVPTPPAVARSHDWSGVYLGGTLGYGWGQTGASDVEVQIATIPVPGPLEQLIQDGSDQSIEGLIGGAFAGVNWQHGQMVFGLEAGFDLDDIGASTSFPVPVNSSVDLSVERDWMATFGGRIGGGFDRVLIFAEGGFAISRATAGFDLTDGGGFTESFEDSQTQYGYYVGAGADFAVTDHVFVGAKYNFVDLGNATYTFTDGTDSVTSTGDAHLHTGKVRLGLKF